MDSEASPLPEGRADGADGLMPEGHTDFQLADALRPLLLQWLDNDKAVDEYTITTAAINHLRQRPRAELDQLLRLAAPVVAVPEAGERASYLEPSRRDWTAEEQRRADRDSGRWCGECRWGEVDDPPCCYDDFPGPVVGEREEKP